MAGFEGLAYDEDSHFLLVLDKTELCAYDAATEAPRWQTSFDEQTLFSVSFAHPSALPPMGGANPWREAASDRIAIVVDAQGGIHATELTRGQRLGSLPPFGKPRAVASSTANQQFALAAGNQVHIWHAGVVREVLLERVAALSFSRDGKTLAIGTEDGQFFTTSLDGASAPPESIVRGIGTVTAIASHPDGIWFVTSEAGAFQIANGRSSRIDKIPAGAQRVVFDGPGKRIAVQRHDRALAAYSWPALSVIARVEYIERPIRGVSFGAENWLGIALDHGDGNKIDVVTSATHRTDTAPGRQHRSWLLRVEGQQRMLSAKDEEDVRRMKSSEPASHNGGKGVKIGIGAGLSFLLLGLRLCAFASRSSSPSYPAYSLPTATPTCDMACAQQHLTTLKADCTADPTLGCGPTIEKARSSLTAGRCYEAKVALDSLDEKSSTASPLFRAHALLAQIGFGEACRSGAIKPAPLPKHTRVVRVSKAGTKTTEMVGEDDTLRPETAKTAYAAPDGTLFVATLTERPQKCMVYRRSAAGQWGTGYALSAPTGDVSLFGRSATDVYLGAGYGIAHFDGKAWTNMATPNSEVLDGVAIGGPDLFAATGQAFSSSAIYKRAGNDWKKETTPAGIDFLALFGAGPAAFAIGEDEPGASILFRRANNAWAKVMLDEGESPRSLWSTPDGKQVFVGTPTSIQRSTDGGATWASQTSTHALVTSIWGRSAKDVYALADSEVLHFDGDTWKSSVTDVDGAKALAGSSTDLFILTSAP